MAKLVELLEKIIGGGTPSKNENKYWNGNIPWASVKDIGENQVYLSYTQDSITKEGLAKSSSNLIPKGNVIIPTRMGLGRCVINKIDTAINQDLKALIPKKDKLNNKYLLYWLKFNAALIESMGSGTTVKGIRLEQLTELELNDIDIKIQQKIARILSNYDDLIENNNRRIKILEEIAQKIYKEWFVDFKFPGHENTTIKESVLSSIITPIKGKNITKSKAKIGNVPVVGGGIEPAYYHNVANTQAPVITISASGANAGFVNLYYKDIWASDCSYIDATMTNYIYYIYLLLKNNQIEITNMQLGAAQPHVYPRDLVDLKIKEFPIEVVANFEKMISPIFENIKVLSNKNENLKQTRDILLPRLISGEINVENMEVL